MYIYIYVYICIYIYIYTCIHVHIHIHIDISTFIHKYACICTHTQKCIYHDWKCTRTVITKIKQTHRATKPNPGHISGKQRGDYVPCNASSCLIRRLSRCKRSNLIRRMRRSVLRPANARHDSFICARDSFICETWSHSFVRHELIHMQDMISFICATWCHSYVRHDSFICETWLIHMCDMISFICETWSYSYVRYDSFICETWSHSYVRYDLIHMWDLTAVWYSHVLTFICSRLIVFIYCIHILSFDKAHATSCFEVTHSYVWHDSFICVTWLVHNVWHDSFIGETRLIHMWDMTHSHARHDSCICETWLVHMWNTTHYQLIRQNDVVFWGLLMWDMTRSHVRHDSVICAT